MAVKTGISVNVFICLISAKECTVLNSVNRTEFSTKNKPSKITASLILVQPDTFSVPLKMCRNWTKIKHLERKALLEDYVKHMTR